MRWPEKPELFRSSNKVEVMPLGMASAQYEKALV